MGEVLSQTESVCPECLQRIPSRRVQEDDAVFLEKFCPQHGDFRTVIWRATPAYKSWVRPKTPSFPKNPGLAIKDGCPYDCGLCADHRQHTCSVLFELTQRCDLGCPVCFADAGRGEESDWGLAEIERWYQRLQMECPSANIQLSGGEPSLRDDLPEIIRLGRRYGFTYFQLNTNGLRLAHDLDFLKALKAAGLSSVFLQFDGTTDAIYQQIRGRALLVEKLAVIAQCRQAGVGVVLVPTLIPGINTQDIGNIIRMGLDGMPTVRGVHFQPISYFGRYPTSPDDDTRITLPEVMQAIEAQTNGLIPTATFSPPGCENALCSFHGNYVQMPDDSLLSTSRRNEAACACQPIVAAEGAAKSRAFVASHWSAYEKPVLDLASRTGPSLGEWEVFLERKRTHTLCVSAMAFQDAWTLDLERLRDCCIHIASRDGRLVPFCAYNLSSRNGDTLYRETYETHTAG